MAFLKKLFEEITDGAVTTADDIGNVQGSLFGGGVITRIPTKPKRKKLKKYKKLKESLVNSNANDTFNPADVISKLSSAANKSTKTDTDIAGFGLEDDEGNIVKVYVRKDQAADFERALSDLMADTIEKQRNDFRFVDKDTVIDNNVSIDDDSSNSDKSESAINGVEIAEIIYELKQKFDIIDVEWGEIPSDEEEEQTVAPENNDSNDNLDIDKSNNDNNTQSSENDNNESDADNTDQQMVDDDTGAQSALERVIDMLKAEAEAKEAEAKAKEAEAKAKEAEYAAKSAAAKVKQEEQVLDMEDYYANKKEMEDEAKKLAKLAKWQHEKATDAETKLEVSESVGSNTKNKKNTPTTDTDEEESSDDNLITIKELSKLIFKHLQGQS